MLKIEMIQVSYLNLETNQKNSVKNKAHKYQKSTFRAKQTNCFQRLKKKLKFVKEIKYPGRSVLPFFLIIHFLQ